MIKFAWLRRRCYFGDFSFYLSRKISHGDPDVGVFIPSIRYFISATSEKPYEELRRPGSNGDAFSNSYARLRRRRCYGGTFSSSYARFLRRGCYCITRSNSLRKASSAPLARNLSIFLRKASSAPGAETSLKAILLMHSFAGAIAGLSKAGYKCK